MNDLTRTTIGSAIRVHQQYGPGLLESVYDEAFTYELRDQGLEVATRVSIPLVYRGRKLSARFEIDLLVGGMLIVEVKSVIALAPIHTAQLLTYLTNVGLRPTPRLGPASAKASARLAVARRAKAALAGPLRPAPLSRRRAVRA